MTQRILVMCSLLTALGLTTLVGCAAEEQRAQLPDVALDQRCIAMASTGDMYRYCMEVGPQQASLESPPS